MKCFRKPPRIHRKLVSVAVSAAFAITLGLSTASAQDPSEKSEPQKAAQQQMQPVASEQPSAAPTVAPKIAKPYYIEFRSRSAQSYGHTFSIYGRLNPHGKIATKVVAGLHPFTESAVPWMIGHLVVVPSETGASDGDTEDQYVTSRFHVALSQEEYRKVTTFIKELQKKSPVWHAVLYNCSAFVGDIARFMGLETPFSTMLMPADYIDRLRELNISRTDLATIIGTPVRVESAAQLRSVALKRLERRAKPASAAASGQTETSGTAVAPANTPPASARQKPIRAGDSSKKSESNYTAANSVRHTQPNLTSENF